MLQILAETTHLYDWCCTCCTLIQCKLNRSQTLLQHCDTYIMQRGPPNHTGESVDEHYSARQHSLQCANIERTTQYHFTRSASWCEYAEVRSLFKCNWITPQGFLSSNQYILNTVAGVVGTITQEISAVILFVMCMLNKAIMSWHNHIFSTKHKYGSLCREIATETACNKTFYFRFVRLINSSIWDMAQGNIIRCAQLVVNYRIGSISRDDSVELYCSL